MVCKAFSAGIAVAALFVSSAHASGFAVNEQSVRGLGRGFAGQTAFADDASTLWYNPASASAFDGRVVTLGASGVFARGEARDRGTTLSTPLGPAPVGGRRGDDPLEPGGVPSAAIAAPLGAGWSAGLSVNAPFGLTTSYASDWFGRYDSTRTELRTGTVTASIAKRAGNFALAAGLAAQYADAVLENALPNIPGAPDGFLQIKGDDWSLGYVVGSRWTPTPDLAFGASYRSAIKHTLEGSERIAGLAGPLAGANRVAAGSARLKTPDIARLGVAWRARPRLTLLGELSWWGWSTFDEIRVASPGAADLVRTQGYEDSLAASAGAEWQASDQLTVRGGVQLEQTPTRAPFRSTRVPDGDRLWISAGATYAPTDRASLDVGLAYVAIERTRVERVDVLFEGSPAARRFDLVGDVKGDALVVGLGASVRF